jgi:hypothetical protein
MTASQKKKKKIGVIPQTEYSCVTEISATFFDQNIQHFKVNFGTV